MSDMEPTTDLSSWLRDADKEQDTGRKNPSHINKWTEETDTGGAPFVYQGQGGGRMGPNSNSGNRRGSSRNRGRGYARDRPSPDRRRGRGGGGGGSGRSQRYDNRSRQDIPPRHRTNNASYQSPPHHHSGRDRPQHNPMDNRSHPPQHSQRERAQPHITHASFNTRHSPMAKQQQQSASHPSPSPNETSAVPESKTKDIHTRHSQTVSGGHCAFVTMVINNPKYLAGAFAMAYSLKRVGSEAHRVLLVDKEIQTSHGKLIQYTKLFDRVVAVPIISCKAKQKRWKRYEESGIYNWIDTAFTKFNVLSLQHYDKVVMLDADMLAVSNPDDIFQLPTPAGINSLWSPNDEPLQRTRHGTLLSEQEVTRAIEREWGIRGCCFMVTPNPKDFRTINHDLKNRQSFGDSRYKIGADEQYLSKYFRGRWHHIDARYGRLSYIDKTTEPSDPVFIHFCTFKPWVPPPNKNWIHERWEDVAIWYMVAKELMEECRGNGESSADLFDDLVKIMGDETFRKDVLKQEWSTPYLQYKCADPSHYIAGLYSIMKQSYADMQSEKREREREQREKLAQTRKQMDHRPPRPPRILERGSRAIRPPQQDIRRQQQSQPQQPLNSNAAPQNRVSTQQRVQRPPPRRAKSTAQISPLALLDKNVVPQKVIWQFWHGNEDTMPVFVQQCLESVRENNPNWTHILLTPQNVFEYLDMEELPDRITDFERTQHMSDAIRVAILARYGGIYCDATLICFPQCGVADFDYIWDELLHNRQYDLVILRYGGQHSKRYPKWPNAEDFCCWFMATKRNNGLFHGWSNAIRTLMRGKTSNRQITEIPQLTHTTNKFKNYVALGAAMLDYLFTDYTSVYNHSNFKVFDWDPRDFAILDHRFNNDQLWYLRNNSDESDQIINEWFDKGRRAHDSGGKFDNMIRGNFLKLFAAERSAEALAQQLGVNTLVPRIAEEIETDFGELSLDNPPQDSIDTADVTPQITSANAPTDAPTDVPSAAATDNATENAVTEADTVEPSESQTNTVESTVDKSTIGADADADADVAETEKKVGNESVTEVGNEASVDEDAEPTRDSRMSGISWVDLDEMEEETSDDLLAKVMSSDTILTNLLNRTSVL